MLNFPKVSHWRFFSLVTPLAAAYELQKHPEFWKYYEKNFTLIGQRLVDILMVYIFL